MLTKAFRHLRYFALFLALVAVPVVAQAQKSIEIPLPQRMETEHRLVLEGTLELVGAPMEEHGIFYREAMIRVAWGELEGGVLPFRISFEAIDDRMESTIEGASMTAFPGVVRGIVRVQPGQAPEVSVVDVLARDEYSLVEDVIRALIVPLPASGDAAGDRWTVETRVSADLTFADAPWYTAEEVYSATSVEGAVALVEMVREGGMQLGSGADAPAGERLHFEAMSDIRATRRIDTQSGLMLSFETNDRLEERVTSYELGLDSPETLFEAALRLRLRLEDGIITVSGDAVALPERPLQIVMAPWIASDPLAYTAKAMLESYFDAEVVVRVAPIEAAWEQLARGEADLFFDAWLPTLHAEQVLQHGDKIEVLGKPIVEMVELGWAVPSYVPIESVAELNDHVEAFGGRIIGLDAGSGMMEQSARVIEAYDLDYELVPGSELDLLLTLDEAIQQGEWIVFLAYRPHYKFAHFDLKVLDEPQGFWAYDDILPLARLGFHDDFPEIAAFLSQWELSLRDYELLIHQIEVLERHPAFVAADWLNARQEQVEGWLPASP